MQQFTDDQRLSTFARTFPLKRNCINNNFCAEKHILSVTESELNLQVAQKCERTPTDTKQDSKLGVYYRPPSQDSNTNELLFKKLKAASKSMALVLMKDFNLSKVKSEHRTAGTKRTIRFLKHMVRFLKHMITSWYRC